MATRKTVKDFASAHSGLAERERDSLTAKLRETEALLKKREGELAVAEDIRTAVFGLADYDLKPPKWIEATKPGKKGVSLPIAMISDEQVGESIVAEEVEGINHYDHKVYVQRHDLMVQKVVEISKHHMASQQFPAVMVAFLGDAINGEIHQELAETNSLQSVPSVALVVETRRNAINFLLKHFERVFAICIPGNHGRCLEASTEVLTGRGWVRADEVSATDEFASVDMTTGAAEFVPCEHLMQFQERGAWSVSGRYRCEMVTREHKVPFKGELTPLEQVGEAESARHFEFPIAGPALIGEDLRYLRLVAWAVFDGTVVDREIYGESGSRLQFRLKKDRKIAALKAVLGDLGVDYTEKLDDDGVCTIRVYGNMAQRVRTDVGAGAEKALPARYARLGRGELEDLLEVMLHTDGRATGVGGIEWSSVCKRNVDIVQSACALNGVPMRSVLVESPSGYPNRKPIYVCHIQPGGLTKRSGDHKIEKAWVDGVFTFVGIQVKHGTLITRRDGRACVTGNTTPKPRFKRYTSLNYETLIGWWLQSLFANEPRVKIVVPQAMDYWLPVFGRGMFFTHGDNLGSGAGSGSGMGFAGPALPIIRGSKKIREQQTAMGRRIDYIHIGHWHSRMEVVGTFANGALAGFNEYAHGLRFIPSPAEQWLYYLHPEHGATARWPIFLSEQPQATGRDDLMAWFKEKQA